MISGKRKEEKKIFTVSTLRQHYFHKQLSWLFINRTSLLIMQNKNTLSPIHSWFFFCNRMMIITHYGLMGNRDGEAQGVRSKAVCCWMQSDLYPVSIYIQYVSVCVSPLDRPVPQWRMKGQDIISSHIDFPAHILNWSCWGIHNWSWFSQSLSFSLFFSPTLKREKPYLFLLSTFFSFFFKRQVLMGRPVAMQFWWSGRVHACVCVVWTSRMCVAWVNWNE